MTGTMQVLISGAMERFHILRRSSVGSLLKSEKSAVGGVRLMYGLLGELGRRSGDEGDMIQTMQRQNEDILELYWSESAHRRRNTDMLVFNEHQH